MSLEYPCIYYRGNGLCSYGGDFSDANICVFGPCENETPSRGDKIRTMSDEELASALVRYEGTEKRTTVYGGHEHIFYGPKGERCDTREEAVGRWFAWLRQPAEED